MTPDPMPTVLKNAVAWPYQPLKRIAGNARLLLRVSPTSISTTIQRRALAQIRSDRVGELWFTPSGSVYNAPNEQDERKIKLGKTLRTLSPLLPEILTKPLPPEILSPTIVLHLFPSTHPHLPSVRGKVPYRAALWTAPVAWGSVPIVGNVKLRILSEKIVRTGFAAQPRNTTGAEEQLVVRWKTEGHPDSPSTAQSTTGATSSSSRPSSPTSATTSSTARNTGLNRSLSKLLGGDKPIFNISADSEFTGLFIFSFDDQGRITSHTIEHADENHGCDKTSRVVTLTDWLLGKAKWTRTPGVGDMVPGLAMRLCREEERTRGSDRNGRRW